jgi:hypothetical protein
MELRKMQYTTKNPKTGRTVWRESEKWYGVWLDFSGILRRLALYADRDTSERSSRFIEQLDRQAGTGQPMNLEQSRRVTAMPPRIRNRLAEWRVIPVTAIAIAKPLKDHVQDWKQNKTRKGRTKAHVDLVVSRALAILNSCGFTFWNDIQKDRIENYLLELREGTAEKAGISAQTYNFYVSIIGGFCKWMIRAGRATENPVHGLDRLPVNTDRRHDRRAFSVKNSAGCCRGWNRPMPRAAWA